MKNLNAHASVLMNNFASQQSAKFILRPTRTTPLVVLDAHKEYLLIKGRSSPENAIGFYGLLEDRIQQYKLSGKPKLNVKLELDYFNTSSAKCLFQLIKNLESLQHSGALVNVYWCFHEDDLDLQETGEDFNESSILEFKMVPLRV